MTNGKLINFVSNLQYYMFPNSKYPLIDLTGYTEKADMEVNCDLSDIDEINKEIERYGLKFILRDEWIDMVIVTDVKKGS
ncbi:MAG: hypothetical protein EOO43_24130 [Flavobacterium sp.]|nr:MAG: hypothetical protein EOO43_24130 [Flavobacterium sp.]